MPKKISKEVKEAVQIDRDRGMTIKELSKKHKVSAFWISCSTACNTSPTCQENKHIPKYIKVYRKILNSLAWNGIIYTIQNFKNLIK